MDNNDNTRSFVPLQNGLRIGQYQIVRMIGAGGMGEVYLARDTKLDRHVAMKFLPLHLAQHADLCSRFVREAQTLARLNHPNIVSIFDVSDYEGRPFYVMEYVEGESLQQIDSSKRLSFEDIVEYAVQVCQGLGEAHRAGIIHRDVKSANIAVDRKGRIRLLDFGLAAVEGQTKLTKTGSTLGTIAYMSPEQVSGREIDQRSDLFSLGIVLYELVTGRNPFTRDSDGATLRAITTDTPEPLKRYKADVPDQLEQIILRLLEKDRDLRYQSAEGVIADLKRLLYDSGQSTVQAEPGINRTLVFAAAALIVVVAVTAYFFWPNNTIQTAEANLPVLVVLPFENLGPASDEYFADGITDEISSRVSEIRGLQVLSLTSVRNYKDTAISLEDLGNRLGATHVLQGTVRWDKSSDIERIRITPRLVQVSNGYQLWSDTYGRDLTEIFAIQADIADQIANQLGLKLVRSNPSDDAQVPTTSVEAYNYYLRGLELTREGVFMINSKGAIAMFDSAIAIDPNFALAWAQKSLASVRYEFASITVDEGKYGELGLEAARRALELDPNLPTAHIALGAYYNFAETDYDAALKELALAGSETSLNADLLEAVGTVKMRQGKFQEALQNFEKAAKIDPLNTQRYFWLSECYALVRNYDAADMYIDRSLVLAQTNSDAGYHKVLVSLLDSGDVDLDDPIFAGVTDEKGIVGEMSWGLGPSNMIGLWRFIPGKYDPVRVITDLRSKMDQEAPLFSYMSIADIYSRTGHSDSARLYFDSARGFLTEVMKNGGADAHIYAALAVTEARLGNYSNAIELGKMANELLPIDLCHW